ncbi:hypothetical protein [Asticcacaulis excentricus]|nr:hypothetical protein [Asticcacaulis excentricus]
MGRIFFKSRIAEAADLAFARSFAGEGPRAQASAGLVFFWAGLLYGLQTLVYAAIEAGWLTVTPPYGLWLAIGPTLPFLGVIAYVAWRERKGKSGVATRALSASYTSAGLLNLVIAVTFGWLAISRQSTTIWLLYPIVICAMQGAVWYAAALIRRKLWLGVVSAGWFVTTLALTLLMTQVAAYLFCLGLALLALMAAPGYVMQRLSARERAPETLGIEKTVDSGADTDPQAAREALAFVKALVDRGEQVQISGGLLLLSGGLLYGLQCLLHGLDMSDRLRLGALGHLINGVLPTILFLIVVGVVVWRDRHKAPANAGSRAINAAFGGVGLANLFMNLVFGYAAFTQKLWLIWMLYPISLCALMGAGWYVAAVAKRKLWAALVCAGWFMTAVLLAWRVETPEYLLILSGALVLLMAVPGYLLMRFDAGQRA